jgi:aspartate kinase
MIVQNISPDGKTTDITFTVPESDYGARLQVLEKPRGDIGYDAIEGARTWSRSR